MLMKKLARLYDLPNAYRVLDIMDKAGCDIVEVGKDEWRIDPKWYVSEEEAKDLERISLHHYNYRERNKLWEKVFQGYRFDSKYYPRIMKDWPVRVPVLAPISAVAGWVFNRKDDIDFLRRDDVSTRFKILNLLSGDRLRRVIAFPSLSIRNAIREYNDLPENEELYDVLYDGETPADVYKSYLTSIMWYVNDAKSSLNDIWGI